MKTTGNQRLGAEGFKQEPFNYLFFGAYFLTVAALHLFHVLLIESGSSVACCFFVLCAVGQALLETVGLIVLGSLIRQFLPRLLFDLFVAAVFLLLLSHLIDFPLVRIMGMSFWFAIHWVLQESYANFIELLLASNVSLWIWAGIGAAGVGILVGGVFIYRGLQRLSERYPLHGTYSLWGGTIVTVSLLLFVGESSLGHRAALTHFEMYAQTLPWKTTFLPPLKEFIILNSPLKEPEEEQEALRSLDSRAFSLSRRPDIYLFVIESLREDYITPEIAPALSQFRAENLSFDLALSNANATQLSWFSLFYSKFPFYFGKICLENWKGGSVPLRMLKKMGYKIQVYSSVRLSYYDMDRLILGESRQLADSYYSLDDSEIEEIYQKDENVIEKLCADVKNSELSSGRVFLVFLDSTHFGYSWPKDKETLFQPVEEPINYLKVAVSNRGLEKIRNRYRNAVHHVDSLVAKVFQELHAYPGGKESIVIITGDHAEEFYEQGHLFHASSLSCQQTHIPLYFKFGQNQHSPQRSQLACHMDVFPSVLHYLIGEDLFSEVLQGQSVFNAHAWPYVVAARFNAGRSPYEFFIHNGTEKVVARFTNESDIFSCKKLQMISYKNRKDENILHQPGWVQEHFAEAIEHIFHSVE